MSSAATSMMKLQRLLPNRSSIIENPISELSLISIITALESCVELNLAGFYRLLTGLEVSHSVC
jgi:hypothetical protein